MSEQTAVAKRDTDALAVQHEVGEFRRNIQIYEQKRRMTMDFIREHLTAGVDYMVIHQKIPTGRKNAQGYPEKEPCPNSKITATSEKCAICGAKPTLLQAGAEKMCSLMQFRSDFQQDRETWEMLGSLAGNICLKCFIVTKAGEIVGEGRGARQIKTDYGDINKSLKMAKKSALIDAIKSVVGLSEIFTQDMEDIAEREESASRPAPTAPPQAPGAAKTAEGGTTPKGPENATTAQIKALHAILKDKAGLQNAIKAVFPGIIIQSSKELTKEQASKLIEWGKDQQAQRACGVTTDPFAAEVDAELDLDRDPFTGEEKPIT